MAEHWHDWDEMRTNLNAQSDMHVGVEQHRVSVSDVSLLPEGLRSHELGWDVSTLHRNIVSDEAHLFHATVHQRCTVMVHRGASAAWIT